MQLAKSLRSKISNARLRCARIVNVEPIVFLGMFAGFLYSTLSQQYFINRYALEDVCQNNPEVCITEFNTSVCISVSDLDSLSGINNSYQTVQQQSTRLVIYITLVERTVSVVSTIILGHLSDRFGRKPVFFVNFVGAILEGVCGLLIVYNNISLYFFILGAFLSGIFGNIATLFTTTFSYLSDISTTKWRTARMGVVEAMASIAVMVSSGATGIWFHKLGCDLGPPLILFLACNLAVILYIVIYLPESLERVKRQQNTKTTVPHLLRGFNIFFGKVEMYRVSLWKLWLCFIPMLVATVAMISGYTIAVFFLKSLNWDSARIGAYFATFTGSNLLFMLVILPIMVALKLPDPVISFIGIICTCLADIFLAIAQETYQIFISK